MEILRQLIRPNRLRRSHRDARRVLQRAGIDTSALDVRMVGDVRIVLADSSRLRLGGGVTLANCTLELEAGAEATLGAGTLLDGAVVSVGPDSYLSTGAGVHIVKTPPYASHLLIRDGRVTLAEEASIRGCMMVRYGGGVHIGVRTFLNQGADIRCDVGVHIGDYTLVSYEAYITDTNSHSLDWRCRREAMVNSPAHRIVGEQRPQARPVRIGDDCWIGKRAMVLKGVEIGDRAIVGAGAVVTSAVSAECVAVGNPAKSRPITIDDDAADRDPGEHIRD